MHRVHIGSLRQIVCRIFAIRLLCRIVVHDKSHLNRIGPGEHIVTLDLQQEYCMYAHSWSAVIRHVPNNQTAMQRRRLGSCGSMHLIDFVKLINDHFASTELNFVTKKLPVRALHHRFSFCIHPETQWPLSARSVMFMTGHDEKGKHVRITL